MGSEDYFFELNVKTNHLENQRPSQLCLFLIELLCKDQKPSLQGFLFRNWSQK